MEHIGPMRRVRPDRSYASHATHQSYSVGEVYLCIDAWRRIA
jgi:hypothetical protein